MAQCSKSASEFIQGAYGPMIAVLCTEDAEIVCQKNNLNFVELIRPFSQLTSEAHIRDPLNLTHPVKGWKLRFVELSAPTPSKDVASQLLNDVVLRAHGPDRAGALSVEDQMKASTPWFEAFRDCFVQMVRPSDHEFIRHFLGCLFVVSSNNTDPLNAFQSLSSALDSQKPSDSIHSKWFSKNIFKYYLMVHDVTDGVLNKAEGIYQSMKSFYGSSICHMLMINSRAVEQHNANPLPDPWSQFIISTSKDTLAMLNDETDSQRVSEAEEEDEVVVDENFDPLIAVKNSNENSGPVLIGPLSFENDVENKTKDKNVDENNVDGRKLESRAHRGTRQLSGGLLSHAGSNGRQHGACLTLSDHDRIRIFIHELAIRGLIPFIERSMRYLYDQITARKGLHKSLFHATKKWFGGGKPVGQTNSSLVPGIMYDSDSPELLWRKLGDLAFLVQNYELAYSSYHTAKRDFNTNHAWLYFAGALEMASISAFMVGSQRQYPSHYMETSISTYVDACRQHQFATRATLFGVEAFKSQGMYSEAAFALLKMTGEESDLLSAILLEQAAHCFLRTKPPRIRKYAFNMILAGHRYSKAAQRKHALRCYKHSLFIYHDKGWRMAEDHINFIIGRQSFNLRQLEDALLAFKELLLEESLQSKEQQASYLREFLFVFQQLSKQKQQTSPTQKTLPILPLPRLQTNSAQIIFAYEPSLLPPEDTATARPLLEQAFVGNPFEKTNTSERIHTVGLHSFHDLQSVEYRRWEQIELETYERVNQIQAAPNFRHFTPCLTNTTNNALKPRSIVNETIGIEVILENELGIPLTLGNMALLWTFLPEEDDEEKRVGNEFEMNSDCVRTEIIKEFSICGNEKKPARLSVIPLRTGNLQITGIKYSLSSVTLSGPVDYINTKSAATTDHPAVSAVSVLGRLDIGVCGPRLNSSKIERSSVMYGEDNRLNIVIVKPMPRLEVTFSGFPTSLLCGELQKVKVKFSNEGEGSLYRLHCASTNANLFAFDAVSSDNKDIDVPEFQKKQLNRFVEHVSKISLPDDCLNSKDKMECTMWVQGRQRSGISNIELLFYYESADANASMSHRTVRHQSTMKTSRSLAIRATCRRCKVTTQDNDKLEGTEENNQLAVTLEVENLSPSDAQFRTFSVLQVSCVSKKWMLKPLSHQKQDGVITINQGETVLTHFKAVRRKHDSDLSISNLAFTGKETDISSLPHWEFLRRSKTWKELNEFEERTDSTMSVDLAIVALWESSYIDSQLSKHTVHGQSEVAVITLAESISAPILTQPAKKPSLKTSDASTVGNTELYIKYTVECPALITHDFEKKRFCTVTVTVTLHNCSQFPVKGFVKMLADLLERCSVKKKLLLNYDIKDDSHCHHYRLRLNTLYGHQNSNTGYLYVRKDENTKENFAHLTSSNPTYFSNYNSAFLWTGQRSKQCRVLAMLATNDENTLMVTQKPPPACLLVVNRCNEVDGHLGSQGNILGLFDYEAVQR